MCTNQVLAVLGMLLPTSVFTTEVHASSDLSSGCHVPLLLRHARSKFCVITAACSMLMQLHCRVQDSNDVRMSHRHTSWRREESGVCLATHSVSI